MKVAVVYVSLNHDQFIQIGSAFTTPTYRRPSGDEALISNVKFVKSAILMVDAILSISMNSWKMGGFTTGFA